MQWLDLTRGGDADHHCKMEGAEGLAYPPIVASGADACTIHYSRNDKVRPAWGAMGGRRHGGSLPGAPCQISASSHAIPLHRSIHLLEA